MYITKNIIIEWANNVVGKKYMIVVQDGFDYECYPVYANEENLQEEMQKYNGINKQKIMKVYNLENNLDEQL